MAFTAPVATRFGASAPVRRAQYARPLATRARPRSCRARIYGLGAAPPPPPSPEEKETAAADVAKGGEEAVVEEESVVAEETTADDILSSPSFLKKKLQIVQNELAEAREAAIKAEDAVKEEKSGYVRLAADFENFRRRSAEDMRRMETKSVAKVCKAMLEVLDNFDRAIANVSVETEREVSIQKSYVAINKQLVDGLGKLKVEAVEPMGDVFDPEVHEAIQQMESNDYKEGVVCNVFQKGYIIGDTLIRAAVVAVSTGPGPDEEVVVEETDAAVDTGVVEEKSAEEGK